MPKLSMQIPHNLGREEATRRIKEHAASFRDQVTDLEENWQDNTCNFRFKAMGFKISGTSTIEDAQVRVDVDLPLPAVMFKGVIEQRLRQDVAGLLT